jgi:hypothetical protein
MSATAQLKPRCALATLRFARVGQHGIKGSALGSSFTQIFPSLRYGKTSFIPKRYTQFKKYFSFNKEF